MPILLDGLLKHADIIHFLISAMGCITKEKGCLNTEASLSNIYKLRV